MSSVPPSVSEMTYRRFIFHPKFLSVGRFTNGASVGIFRNLMARQFPPNFLKILWKLCWKELPYQNHVAKLLAVNVLVGKRRIFCSVWCIPPHLYVINCLNICSWRKCVETLDHQSYTSSPINKRDSGSIHVSTSLGYYYLIVFFMLFYLLHVILKFLRNDLFPFL